MQILLAAFIGGIGTVLISGSIFLVVRQLVKDEGVEIKAASIRVIETEQSTK